MTNTDTKGTFQTLDSEKRGPVGLMIAATIIALGALFFFVSAAQGHSNPELDNFSADKIFSAILSNSEEVPTTNSSASGHAHFALANANTMLRHQLIVHDGTNITAAHLHCGARGVNGPVVVNLYTDDMRLFTHGELAADSIETKHILSNGVHCSPKITSVATLVQAMREGKVYLNVHSTQNPGGDIRGQVVAHEPATSTFSLGDLTLTVNKNNIRITGEGLDINEVGGAGAGKYRFMVTISETTLKKLGNMYSVFAQAVDAILNR